MKIEAIEDICHREKSTLIAELKSEALTLKETLDHVIAPVIDNGNWVLLEKFTADSRGMEQMATEDTLRKERHETASFLSDGKNLMELLDFTEQSHKVIHDPIIRIVGIDAIQIGQKLAKNMVNTLCQKLLKIQINKKVLDDLQQLTKKNVAKLVEDIKTEAELSTKQQITADW